MMTSPDENRPAFSLLRIFHRPRSIDAQAFEVAESPIAGEEKAMIEGRVTSKALVQAYLDRIGAFDHRGPRLNALITLNPNALREAEALDRERAAKRPLGPLHGIPVIVKDNYSTADMQTTAPFRFESCVTPAQ
jgi:amidase